MTGDDRWADYVAEMRRAFYAAATRAELEGLGSVVEFTQPNPGISSPEKATSRGEVTLDDITHPRDAILRSRTRGTTDG